MLIIFELCCEVVDRHDTVALADGADGPLCGGGRGGGPLGKVAVYVPSHSFIRDSKKNEFMFCAV